MPQVMWLLFGYFVYKIGKITVTTVHTSFPLGCCEDERQYTHSARHTGLINSSYDYY